MKKLLSIFGLLIAAGAARGGNKIHYYFTRPVNNTVARGENAVYLNNCAADTLAAYISRAKYTLDIAVYNFNLSSGSAVTTAVNNAYNRGVQVRWIYDGSSANTGLTGINAGIPRLGSPTTSAYGIMHNKFMVIDGGSTNAADAVVWTGSTNWTTNQVAGDYNNIVVIQDSALAHAYVAHFNMMWGGSGMTPSPTASKFGPDKTDLGRHVFTIEGKRVEVYFSPADGTNTQIQNVINTADKDLYFAMYTFTDNTDANLIMARKSAGVYVAGIDDSYSNTYTPYTTFTSGLGANFKVYSGSDLYHNKFLIVDQSDVCSDPLVLTGSHNWTISANTKNDENTLVIHDDTAANVYYQSFYANFIALGGALTAQRGCSVGLPAAPTELQESAVFPNPSAGDITVSYALTSPQNVTIELYDMLGRKQATLTDNEPQNSGRHQVAHRVAASGMYLVRIVAGASQALRSIVVTNR